MSDTTTWHPDWCSQVEDDANGTEVFHYSHAEVLERSPGQATPSQSGEGFRVELKRCLNYESGPQYMDEWDVAGRLSIESEAFDEKVDLFLGPNKLRDLADFLFTEADRLDAWHEEQRAKFAAGDPQEG